MSIEQKKEKSEQKSIDEMLVDEVLRGDLSKFEELIERYQQMIVGYCIRVLGTTKEDGEDAAQDVFLKVYKNLAQFKKESSFKTWIYKIAINHCLDVKRTSVRREKLLSENKSELSDNVLFKESDNPEANRYEDLNLINKAFEMISTKEKSILILREVEELSYIELASTLSCTVESVRAKLRRARESFTTAAKKLLEEDK